MNIRNMRSWTRSDRGRYGLVANAILPGGKLSGMIDFADGYKATLEINKLPLDILGVIYGAPQTREEGHLGSGSDAVEYWGEWKGVAGNARYTSQYSNATYLSPESALAAVLGFRTADLDAETSVLSDPVKHLERELKRHDWYFAFSDDHGVFMGGGRHRDKIGEMISLVDEAKARELWKKHAPEEFDFPESLVNITEVNDA